MANMGLLGKIKEGFKESMQERPISWSFVGIAVVFLGWCWMPRTFRVLDAETKKPIEGAVALADWQVGYGLPGLSYSRSGKIVEDVSDAKGKFRISRFDFRPQVFVNQPLLQVYKPGYVGWNSRWIYLGCYEKNRNLAKEKERENFFWINQDIYLEPWKDEYSYISHENFISTGADFSVMDGIAESKYKQAIHSELPFAYKEWAELNRLNVKNSMKLNGKRK